MHWIIALVLLALFMWACLWLRKRPSVKDEKPEASLEDLAEAAIELHQISGHLDVALTRHELHGDALHARRELDQELRLLKVLEREEDGDEAT